MASKTSSKTITKQSGMTDSVVKRCTLDNRKAPTPKVSELRNTAKAATRQPKDHVHENIALVKKLEITERPPVLQDSCDGHRQDIEKAGLELKYVFKKGYGEVPKYIRKKRYEQEKRESVVVHEEPTVRKVEEEEKQAVLQGLKNNLREVEKLLLSLPLIIDTVSKQKYKKGLENRLVQLQQDIETLENHDVLVINERRGNITE